MALLPVTPKPSSVNITTVSQNVTTFALNGRRQVKSQGSQYFKFDISYPNMRQSDMAPLMAFLTNVKGQFDAFTIILPQISDNHAGYTGANPTVPVSGSVGDTSIGFTGASSNTLLLKAGDFINFDNIGHTKSYMVTADVTTDASGNGTINFTPGLVKTVVINDEIAVKDIQFSVILDSDTTEFQHGMASVTGLNISVREAF
jgi:hypothetical protein